MPPELCSSAVEPRPAYRCRGSELVYAAPAGEIVMGDRVAVLWDVREDVVLLHGRPSEIEARWRSLRRAFAGNAVSELVRQDLRVTLFPATPRGAELLSRALTEESCASIMAAGQSSEAVSRGARRVPLAPSRAPSPDLESAS